ncbi:MAG: hypothetical protein MZV63_62815 [Marinilabiliales bacterium]|nr:hypothetical protein [Marinilabiliales bacterium]
MDRMLLESFPFRVIEGMLIAAAATGATEGIFYIRAEYPLAVEELRPQSEYARKRGILRRRATGRHYKCRQTWRKAQRRPGWQSGWAQSGWRERLGAERLGAGRLGGICNSAPVLAGRNYKFRQAAQMPPSKVDGFTMRVFEGAGAFVVRRRDRPYSID